MDLFELHEEYVLSPGQVLESIERLSAVGYVQRDGLRAKLTDEGRQWVMFSRRELFMSPHIDWRSFETNDRLVEEFEPYFPSLKKVDRGHFINFASRK
jgi:hypothetical protein